MGSFLPFQTVGKSHFRLLGVLLALLIALFATPSMADSCRLNTKVAAGGLGHNAACVVGLDGRLQTDGALREIRGQPPFVDLDENGDLTKASMEKIVTAYADYYGVDEVNVSHFPEADDLANAEIVGSQITQAISNGQRYHMFKRNCDDIASQMIVAAGAEKVKDGLIPNAVSLAERKGPAANRIARGDWSGQWLRNGDRTWSFSPGE
ncbi:MAG: hypothetical protein FD128_1861 [Hyphomonadaceae bacterium]|nr:MAG: hypothetical protein FD128_1861 [Hyphomonadaceae bacterium]